MKKRRFIIALLVSITLCGCSIHDESKGQQTESVDINEEKQDKNLSVKGTLYPTE